MGSGGEEDVARYAGTYMERGGGRPGEEEGRGERGAGPAPGADINLVGQARGGQSRGERGRAGERRDDDDDAILSPLCKRLSPQLSPQPFLSPIPRLFAMAGLLSAGPTAALMRAEWPGLLPPPGDVTSRTSSTGASKQNGAGLRAGAGPGRRRRRTAGHGFLPGAQQSDRVASSSCPCRRACAWCRARAFACATGTLRSSEAARARHISCGLPPRDTTVSRMADEIIRVLVAWRVFSSDCARLGPIAQQNYPFLLVYRKYSRFVLLPFVSDIFKLPKCYIFLYLKSNDISRVFQICNGVTPIYSHFDKNNIELDISAL
jgi:hypothetical protein